jgi:hypothetical protein
VVASDVIINFQNRSVFGGRGRISKKGMVFHVFCEHHLGPMALGSF